MTPSLFASSRAIQYAGLESYMGSAAGALRAICGLRCGTVPQIIITLEIGALRQHHISITGYLHGHGVNNNKKIKALQLL